ncbi:type II secretion system protein [bacterium]|nr:type II secretion system protein [bacterium]
MKKRAFSMTEIMVALVIMAVLIVPIVNNMRQSSKKTQKMGKKLMALALAENLISHLELYYSKKSQPLEDKEEVFPTVNDLMNAMFFQTNADITKVINSNYHGFIPKYILEKDGKYPDRIMKVTVEIYWKEKSGNRMIKYIGEVVK